MVNIIKQEIEIDSALKYKIEFICSFCNTTPTIYNGSIRTIEHTNLTYVEPHRVIINGITAEKIKETLNNFKTCSDKNGTCLITKPEKEIEKIFKSIGLEVPNLTTLDKIDKLKNQLNKGVFM